MIKQGQVRVYCCGGAAINIVYPLIEVGHGASDPGYADIEYTVLDTSRSNLLGKDIPDDIFFHVENREKDITDGSGKVKTTNLGSLFRLRYDVTLRSGDGEKALIDALRCRNGNLEICVSPQSTLAQGL